MCWSRIKVQQQIESEQPEVRAPFDSAQSGQQNFGNPPTYDPQAYNPGQFAAFNHQQYGQTSFASPPPYSSGQQFWNRSEQFA